MDNSISAHLAQFGIKDERIAELTRKVYLKMMKHSQDAIDAEFKDDPHAPLALMVAAIALQQSVSSDAVGFLRQRSKA